MATGPTVDGNGDRDRRREATVGRTLLTIAVATLAVTAVAVPGQAAPARWPPETGAAEATGSSPPTQAPGTELDTNTRIGSNGSAVGTAPDVAGGRVVATGRPTGDGTVARDRAGTPDRPDGDPVATADGESASTARTFVVDGDGGGDFRTIQAALDAAGDGDRVEVRPGIYREALTIRDNVTLVAPAGATLNGSGLGAPSGIFVTRSAGPVVDGIRVVNYRDSGFHFEYTEPDWTVRNVTVRNSSDGIFLNTIESDFRLRDVTIEAVGTGVYGLTLSRFGSGDLRDVRIRNARRGIKAATGETFMEFSIRNLTVENVDRGAEMLAGWHLHNATFRDVRDTAVYRGESGAVVDGVTVKNATVGVSSDYEGFTLRNARLRGVETGVETPDFTVFDPRRPMRIENVTVRDAEVAVNASDAILAVEATRLAVADAEVAVDATGATEQVTVTGSSLAAGSTVVDATGARVEVNASRNWWGNRSGPAPGDCVGNVTCSDPLADPPRLPAGGTVLAVDAGAGRAPPGGTVAVNATVDVASTPLDEVELRLGNVPERWEVRTTTAERGTWNRTTGTLTVTDPPTETALDASVSLAVPGGVTPGEYRLELTVGYDRNGRERSLAPVPVTATVTEPVAVQPTAAFEVTPSTPDPNATVRLNGSASTAPAPDSAIVSINWDVGDDGRVDATGRTAEYRFDAPGTYAVRLTVVDSAGREATTVGRVEVGAGGDGAPDDAGRIDAAFEVRPAAPTAEESVAFDAAPTAVENATITGYTWVIGTPTDGRLRTGRLTGRRVTETLETGETTVQLIVTGTNGTADAVSRTVTVAPPGGGNVSVTAIRSRKPEPVPNELVFSNTYRAVVAATEPLDRVEFTLKGETYTDRDGSDGWTAEVPLQGLDRDRQMTVTAVTERGDRATATTLVDVTTDIPGWVLAFNRSSVGYDDGVVTISRDVPSPPIDEDVTVPKAVPVVGGTQEVTVEGTFGVAYDAPAAIAEPSASGTLEGKAFGRGATGSLGVSGRIDVGRSRWDLEGGKVTAGVSIAAIEREYTVSIPYSPAVSLLVEPGVEATLRLDDGGDLGVRPTGGSITPLTTGSGGVTVGVGIGEVGADLTTTVSATITVPRLEVGGRGELVGTAWLDAWWGNRSFAVGPFAETVGNDSVASASATASGGWTVADRRGSKPFAGTGVGSGPGASVSAAAPGGAVPEATRLTDDRVEDASPALVRSADGLTAVWSRQSPNEPVTAGRDIVVARRTTDGWTEPTHITDDSRFQVSPALAATRPNATDESALAVWTVLDRNYTGAGADTLANSLSEVTNNTEIAYSVRTTDGWSEPRTLTNDSGADLNPTVVRRADEWLVAWEADVDGDVTTRADRRVELATVVAAEPNSGPTVAARGTVPDAVEPVPTADGGLAYFDPPGTAGRNGSVRVASLSPTLNVTPVASYDAVGYVGHTIADGRLVWADRAGARVRTASTTGSRSGTVPALVPVSESVTSVRNPSLFAVNGTTVLTYRGREGPEADSQLRYLVRNDTDWVVDRPFVRSPDPNATFQSPSLVATDGDGFAALFAGEPLAPDGRGDVFATERRLRPDLVVNATVVTSSTAGESATVTYRLRNLGGRPTGGTTAVALVANGSVVDRATHSSLAVGAARTGQLSGEVPPDGRLQVRANASGLDVDQRTAANDRVTLTAARPALSVDDVTATRTGRDIVVTAAIRNRGGATARNVTVRVSSGGATIATVPAEAIHRDTTERVATTVTRTSVNDTLTVEASSSVLAPRTDAPGDAETIRPFRPDLAVSDGSVEYRWGDGRLQATVAIANRGTGATTATLRVVDPETGETLANRPVRVAPRRVGTQAAFTQATVPLPGGLADGQRVGVIVTAPFETNATDNAATSVLRRPPGAPAVVGGTRPTDPDGDGRYEDVDGSGTLAYADVVALFEAIDTGRLRAVTPFDFNGNGQLDFDDIVDLFEAITD